MLTRIWMITNQFPGLPFGSSLCNISSVYLQSKAALCIPVRLALASIVFFAATSAALVPSHVAHADPIKSENQTGENFSDPHYIQVNIDSGRLTLDAVDASLVDVLTRIGKQAGVEIFLSGDLDVSVTSSFSNEPLAGAIARLLGDTSFVMVYGQSQSVADPPPLTEIRVNGGSASQAAPAGVSADELNEDQ
ncbi:MAG: hypothetical protein OEL78_01255, partial [Hyphomicrobiales bacterium]|nr:hypothetical protein [Hyphomicrobiales bacterium]